MLMQNEWVDLSLLEQPVAYAAGMLIGDKYLLEQRLGCGGMGTVWLARNVTLDSAVAIKLIHPAVRGLDTSARLLTEARVEASLNHPGIVRVFDFGQTDRGDSFIVMEPLEGRSLGDMLVEQGRLSPMVAVQLILPVIEALCCAHFHGVVHRDLKPENIFIADVEPHGMQPKVLDFGIAKLIDGCADFDRTITVGGTVMGTAAYMAPEQARGEADVDVRADIWSLCVVLYEAVSGRPAFNGGSNNALLCAVIEHAITPLHDEVGGEASLWRILRRGLAKNRDRRFSSMRELGNALAFWLVERGVQEDICGQRLERAWRPRELERDAVTARHGAAVAAAPTPAAPAERPSSGDFEYDFQRLATVDTGSLSVPAARPHAVHRLPWASVGTLVLAAALGVFSLGIKIGFDRAAAVRQIDRAAGLAANIERPERPAGIRITGGRVGDPSAIDAPPLGNLTEAPAIAVSGGASDHATTRRPGMRAKAADWGLKDPY